MSPPDLFASRSAVWPSGLLVAKKLAVNLSRQFVHQGRILSCPITSSSMIQINVGGPLPLACHVSSHSAKGPTWTHVIFSRPLGIFYVA